MMIQKREAKAVSCIGILVFMFVCISETDSFARAGSGRFFGSRGSRSYTIPSKPYQPQNQNQQGPAYPDQQKQIPSPNPAYPPNQQQPGSGFLRGLAGGIVGGIIGNILFGCIARAFGLGMGGFGGSGIGLLDILLIGVLIYGVYRFFRRQRLDVGTTGTYCQREIEPYSRPQSYGMQTDPIYHEWERPSRLEGIRCTDPYFDERKFKDLSMDIFFKIKAAWIKRDLNPVHAIMADEIFGTMNNDVVDLKAQGRINRLDNIAVRAVDIVESWQDGAVDFITVRFLASVIDYTVSESGELLSGSKNDPVKSEEYWTFTRHTRDTSWRLSAINQAS